MTFSSNQKIQIFIFVVVTIGAFVGVLAGMLVGVKTIPAGGVGIPGMPLFF